MNCVRSSRILGGKSEVLDWRKEVKLMSAEERLEHTGYNGDLAFETAVGLSGFCEHGDN